jgi:hypothetical protein
MGQVLHGCATTTEAIRRAIQNSQESLRALSKLAGSPTHRLRGRRRLEEDDRCGAHPRDECPRIARELGASQMRVDPTRKFILNIAIRKSPMRPGLDEGRNRTG